MFKFLVAARKEGKIQTPNPLFDNECVRYEHRFGAFVGLLTPPLAPYTQYKVSAPLAPYTVHTYGNFVPYL